MLLVDDHSGPVRTVLDEGKLRILVMDSIAFASPDMAGHLIVTGSHGGTSAGEYARHHRVAAVACNDAGIGKDAAGIAGLAAIDDDSIVGVAVGHDTARIGDGTDTWMCGVVTYANATALAAGIRPGQPLNVAFTELAGRWSRGGAGAC